MEYKDSRRHRINSDTLMPLLLECFPGFTKRTYTKVNYGRNFLEWIWGEMDSEIVCCAAIFRRNNGYKMGLFCVHPQKRRQGIGTDLFNYLTEHFYPLEWTAKTPESINFYRKLNTVEGARTRALDGEYYTVFTSNDQRNERSDQRDPHSESE